VPTAGEAVAAGACVQAASTVVGRPPIETAQRWQLDASEHITPPGHVDADAVRSVYDTAAAAAASLAPS
jgi:hypothetical protein